jgi:hypothetical protein
MSLVSGAERPSGLNLAAGSAVFGIFLNNASQNNTASEVKADKGSTFEEFNNKAYDYFSSAFGDFPGITEDGVLKRVRENFSKRNLKDTDKIEKGVMEDIIKNGDGQIDHRIVAPFRYEYYVNYERDCKILNSNSRNGGPCGEYYTTPKLFAAQLYKKMREAAAEAGVKSPDNYITREGFLAFQQKWQKPWGRGSL